MDKIAEKLDTINETLQAILGAMNKPGNTMVRALEMIGLGAGALSIFGTADIIRKWIIGG